MTVIMKINIVFPNTIMATMMIEITISSSFSVTSTVLMEIPVLLFGGGLGEKISP